MRAFSFLGLGVQARQAQVAELGRAALVNQDIVGLDVAVQDAVRVGVRQGQRHGLADLQHLRFAALAPAPMSSLALEPSTYSMAK